MSPATFEDIFVWTPIAVILHLLENEGVKKAAWQE